jgi:hypothetical protein
MAPGLSGLCLREIQELGVNSCEIPHLAKNERDVGHPVLVTVPTVRAQGAVIRT